PPREWEPGRIHVSYPHRKIRPATRLAEDAEEANHLSGRILAAPRPQRQRPDPPIDTEVADRHGGPGHFGAGCMVAYNAAGKKASMGHGGGQTASGRLGAIGVALDQIWRRDGLVLRCRGPTKKGQG